MSRSMNHRRDRVGRRSLVPALPDRLIPGSRLVLLSLVGSRGVIGVLVGWSVRIATGWHLSGAFRGHRSNSPTFHLGLPNRCSYMIPGSLKGLLIITLTYILGLHEQSAICCACLAWRRRLRPSRLFGKNPRALLLQRKGIEKSPQPGNSSHSCKVLAHSETRTLASLCNDSGLRCTLSSLSVPGRMATSNHFVHRLR